MMNWSDLVTIVATLIISLGGGGAIVLGLSNWIGKILADRYAEKLKHEIQQEIESYKMKLKKSEFLFLKEFEAASQFISLHHNLLPSYRFPDMDWYDACEDFAGNFENVEKELNRYIATYGAVLSQQVLECLNNAISKAASRKFEVSLDDVSKQDIALAEKVMEELQKIEIELRRVVWSQSST